MKRVLSIVLVLFTGLGFSKTNHVLDSLLTNLESLREDTAKANTLNLISKQYYRSGDYTTALEYANKALQLAKEAKFDMGYSTSLVLIGVLYQTRGELSKAMETQLKALKIKEALGDQNGIAACMNGIGTIYLDQGNYSAALDSYLKCLAIKERQGDRNGTAITLINLGLVYNGQGNYNKALDSYFKGLKIKEELHDKIGTAAFLNNIGNVYTDQLDYPKALEYLQRALKLKEEAGDKKGIASSLNNIGGIYNHLEKYAKALEYFQRALLIKEEIGDKQGIAISLINIGGTYGDQAQHEKAIEYYLKSLKIYEEVGDNLGAASALLNIGIVNHNQGKYRESITYIDKGLAKAKEGGDISYQRDAYLNLSKAYSKLKMPEEALENYKKYVVARDSMINENNTREITRHEMNYEFEKKEVALKAEQEKKDALAASENKRQKIVIWSVSGLFALCLVIGLLFIRQRKLRTEQRAMALEQKLLRSQMNPHFIFNSLQAIQSYILKHNEKDAAKYLTSFASVTRSVLENSRMELIPVQKEIRLLENYLVLQKLRFGDRFDYRINLAPELDEENTLIPPMLSQPFIENALEHGLRDIENGGLIEISFLKRDERLVLEIKDNGTGMPEEPARDKSHQSLATAITKERIALMNKKLVKKISFAISAAYINEQIRKGVKVSFTLPLNYG